LRFGSQPRTRNYSEILDDEQAATVTAFTRRALDWFLDHGTVTE
jgi:hypothetical protein